MVWGGLGCFHGPLWDQLWATNPFKTNGTSGWTIVYIEGLQVIFSKNIQQFLSLKIDSILANSADPDEMPQYATFHLGPHCLPRYPFKGFWFTKG